MTRQKKEVTYETRFKYKLNMLEPGTKILQVVGVSFALGLVCRLLSWLEVMWFFLGLAGALLLALFILVAIELRQDRILNNIAMEEMRRNERM